MGNAIAPSGARQLLHYDAACKAIAEAAAIDDVKTISDEAVAIEVYARQAKDTTLERQAIAIRVRAQQELGARLAAVERQKPGPSGNKAPNGGITKVLENIGLRRSESSRLQRLATVPAAQVAAILDAEAKSLAHRTSGAIIRSMVGETTHAKPRPTDVSRGTNTNELQSLRDENAALKAQLNAMHLGDSAKAAVAEIDRLTAALRDMTARRDEWQSKCAAAQRSALYWKKRANGHA